MAKSTLDLSFDCRRDISVYALKKADNGTWYYTSRQIISILRTIYKEDLPYAESTIDKKISEARKSIS